MKSKAPGVTFATAAATRLRKPRSPIPTRPTAPWGGASAARSNPRQPVSVGEGTAVLRLRWLVTTGSAVYRWHPLADRDGNAQGTTHASVTTDDVAAAAHNKNTSRPIPELPTASEVEASAAQCSLRRPWQVGRGTSTSDGSTRPSNGCHRGGTPADHTRHCTPRPMSPAATRRNDLGPKVQLQGKTLSGSVLKARRPAGVNAWDGLGGRSRPTGIEEPTAPGSVYGAVGGTKAHRVDVAITGLPPSHPHANSSVGRDEFLHMLTTAAGASPALQ